MSDTSKSTSKSTPSWQQANDSAEEREPGVSTDLTSEGSTESGKTESSILEQASKFLDDAQIKDASDERKYEFLEQKGLTNDEIQKLIAESRSKEERNAVHTGPPGEDSEIPNREPQESLQSNDQSSSPSTLSHPAKDTPPIITYPEFLLHSQKPPPLITAQRLLTTFYAVSGTAALTYGTSKYIVEPMVESLTSARHFFAERAMENLQTLNEKLEEVVSVLPEVSKAAPDSIDTALDDVKASAFFHRSAATQTSPHLSRSNSTSSSDSLQQPSAIESQATKLEKLEAELQKLSKPSDSFQFQNIASKRDLREEVDNLQTYLSRLTYGGMLASEGGQKKEDGIAKLKGEIRQTKGVLLSSRNFPSSTAARGWGSAAS